MALKINVVTISIIVGWVGLCMAQQDEKLTITTYYPSPTGVYQTLRIAPGANPADCSNPATAPRGKMYYDSTENMLYICSSDGISTGYQLVPGGNGAWAVSGDKLYVMNATMNVAIGTTNPLSPGKLEVAGPVFTTGTGGSFYVAPRAGPGTALHAWYNPNGIDSRFYSSSDGDLVTITNDGKVGIGTTAPESSFVVAGNASMTPSINSIQMGIESNGYTAIELAGSPTAGTVIDFTTPGSSYNGRILYKNADNMFEVWTNATAGAKMVIDTDGKVGIGTSTPVSKLHLANNVATYPLDDFSKYQMLLYQGATPASSYGLGIASGVMWFNTNGDIMFSRQGTETVRITNGNIQAQGYLMGNAGSAGGRLNDRGGDNRFSVDWSGSPNTLKFYIEDVNVKTFIIDNPLDSSKYLIHTTLEGPENAVFYRGEAQLNEGAAEIVLPEYFEALTREESRTVLLTPFFQGVNEKCSSLAASSVKDGRFFVKAIDGNNPQQSFYWEVKAVRKDVPVLLVQPDKDEVEVHGVGPYKYYSLKNSR